MKNPWPRAQIPALMMGCIVREEDSSGRGNDFDDADMEDYWVLIMTTLSYGILSSMVLVSESYPIFSLSVTHYFNLCNIDYNLFLITYDDLMIKLQFMVQILSFKLLFYDVYWIL